jgi:glycosyltransferase involved in cell wall biosynthesis
MSRKKVLILGHTYTAPVNRMKFDLMAEDPRFEILLVTPKRWRNLLTETDNSTEGPGRRYRVIFADVRLGWHPVTYILRGLRKIIQEFQPDLIYCEQEPICLVSVQAALMGRKTPIIYFTWENIDRKDLRYRLFGPVRALCLQMATLMVAGSKDAAGVIRRHGYKKPIYITPILGVSEELFFPKFDEVTQSDNGNGLSIAYIGRLVEEKDVHTLLKAVRLLDSSIDWRLFLLGGGPLRGEYEAFILKSGIKDRVTFHPPVPHDKVPEFFKKIDVLVLPSKTMATWKEQFGHVLVEAMACGIPVVGSSSGEIPTVIGKAGLVFKEGDAEDLRDKLAMLHEPALRKDMHERGMRRVKERYTDLRIAQNMIALCEIGLGMERSVPNTLEEYPG